MSFKIRPCQVSTTNKVFEVGCLVIDADPLMAADGEVWCTIATRKDPKEAAQLCNYLNGGSMRDAMNETRILDWITPQGVFTVEGL